MPDATVQQVLDDVRSHLADNAISGGEIYTNTVLLPFFQMAYREMFRVMQTIQLPRVQTTAYYNLPAQTGYLDPSTAGISDMGEPWEMGERQVTSALSVSAISITSSVPTLTTAAHGLTDGDRIVVYKAGGVTGVNGLWAVNVTSSTQFELNGAVAVGTYTSGGVASTSDEDFQDIRFVDEIDDTEGDLPDRLRIVAWVGDVFRFVPCSQIRQLRIRYISSGNAPTLVTDSVGLDDAKDYLAVRTAGLACASKGAPSRASELNTMALGPKQVEADASGGLLRQLMLAGVLQMQSQRPIRMPPFRQVRSNVPEIY